VKILDPVRLLGLVVIALLTMDQANAANSDTACQKLAKVSLPHRQIVSATSVAAEMFQAPDGLGYHTPAFCRVQVIAKPTSDSEIHLEVWLPSSENWNGRYYQLGQGGGGGSINYAGLADFVREGAVAAATDDGQNLYAFSDKHPEKIIDNAERALKETTDSAKALTLAYYQRAAHHRYFAGCSDGGAYALRAAQRFPEDWDGILAGAPSYNETGGAASDAWNVRAWLDDPKGHLLPRKLATIQRAALASCTSRAHVVNGIATDPRFCAFDPAVLSCKGAETDDCLTASQIATLRKIYDGPRNSRSGAQIYAGFPPTSETSWPGAITPLSGLNPEYGKPPGLLTSNIFYQYVFGDPEWNIRRFDVDSTVAFTENKRVAGRPLKAWLDATDPDLSSLRDRGSKMIMYSGWADPGESPLESIRYYESVARSMGGVDKISEFFRLFMVPGMGHCSMKGPGVNAFGQWLAPALRDDPEHNIARALEAWVETNRKPDQVIATKYVDDDLYSGVAFTRPLCPYPQVAVYRGRGDVADASNFDCRMN
jgi:hypothetical protein